MYAFCRVQDPNSGLPKYVLINWTGEGVADSRKGLCANHVSSVASFLKGAHVTINARTEDDVEPETILGKVAKASGANFNFHKQTQNYRDAPRGPVGSVYRKVNAVEEIQQTKKDDFWVQTQRDEEIRRKEESRRAEQERQRMEREMREQEERQAKERERRANERNQQIERERVLQKKREEEEREKEQQKQQIQEENRSKVTGINAAASVQKANEAKSLISQRSFNPKDIFKQREQSFKASTSLPPASSRPGKLQSPFLSQKSFEREVLPKSQSPPAPIVLPTPPVKAPSPVSPASPVLAPAAVSFTPPQLPVFPVQSAEVSYPDEEEWSDEFDDDAADDAEPLSSEPYEAPVDPHENLYQNTEPAEYQDQDWNEQEPESGLGLRARALYDYQAADESEITFDPDDIITNIEKIDEGWWRGVGPSGNYGLFPSNYVELL
ncbi:drebrin-like protein B isoform X2 [Oryzias melastigma]|nr:drebrin-like protein B isoform X2 [Oryzias melastigma]